MKTFTLRKTYTYYTTVVAEDAQDAVESMQDVSETDLDLDAAIDDWHVIAEVTE